MKPKRPAKINYSNAITKEKRKSSYDWDAGSLVFDREPNMKQKKNPEK